MECGHFITRERMATRYHPMNVNAEGEGCNKLHRCGMNPDKGYPYGLAIDNRYGEGAAKFLWNLAYPKHEKNKIAEDEGWTTDELSTLRAAAKKGDRVYEAIYYELRPHHRFSALPLDT